MAFSFARITSQAARSAGLMNSLGSINISLTVSAYSAGTWAFIRRSLFQSQDLGSMLCAVSTRCCDVLCSQWTKNSARCQQVLLYDVVRSFIAFCFREQEHKSCAGLKICSKLCVGCQGAVPHLGCGSPLGMPSLDLAREMALPLHPFVCAVRHT